MQTRICVCVYTNIHCLSLTRTLSLAHTHTHYTHKTMHTPNKYSLTHRPSHSLSLPCTCTHTHLCVLPGAAESVRAYGYEPRHCFLLLKFLRPCRPRMQKYEKRVCCVIAFWCCHPLVLLTYVHAYIYAYMYAYMHAYILACMHACRCECMYAHLHTYVHA